MQPELTNGDLRPEDVAPVLVALGYTPSDAEVREVAVRLNALLDGLRKLDAFEVDHVEPAPGLHQDPR